MAGCPSGSRESSAKGMLASSNLVPASFIFACVIALRRALTFIIPAQSRVWITIFFTYLIVFFMVFVECFLASVMVDGSYKSQ